MTAPLRVATWNVRTGLGLDGRDAWPLRAGRARAVLAGLGADVVGVQEVHGWQLRSLRRALPDHVAVGEGRSRWRTGERCALLVHRSTTLVRHRTLWLSDAPTVPGSRLPGASHPRVVTLAELDDPRLGRLLVAVTHLDHRVAANRRRGASLVSRWLAAAGPDLPWVVLGDLNARPGAAALAPLAEAGLLDAVPPGAGGTAHGFTGRTDGARIDHVLVRGLAVLDAHVVHAAPGGRPASDHWPVVADLAPPGTPPAGRT